MCILSSGRTFLSFADGKRPEGSSLGAASIASTSALVHTSIAIQLDRDIAPQESTAVADFLQYVHVPRPIQDR